MDAYEGKDYYATPEPLGLLMMEWADARDGDRILEPSAGHGAIARYAPDNSVLTVVEPSFSLNTALRSNVRQNARVVNGTFEDLDIGNKYDTIVMNPPFGHAGRTALQHVTKAFRHLSTGGRLVALVPNGSVDLIQAAMPDDMTLIGKVSLPSVTFQNAGTDVRCTVMVMEKNEELVVVPKNLEMPQRDDLETFFEDLKRLGNPFGRRVPITGQADGQESAMKMEDFVRTDTGETRKKVTWEKSLSRDDFTRIHDMAKRHNGFGAASPKACSSTPRRTPTPSCRRRGPSWTASSTASTTQHPQRRGIRS